MGGGKGTSVPYPTATKEERALMAKQLAMLEASEAREKMWEPILMQNMGYKYDESGNLIPMSQEEKLAAMSAAERQAYDIASLASDRELKALRGELPVDPATERELGTEEARLRQSMFNQLGGGWETSTAGIQALGEQQQRAAAIRDAVRRGEMTTSESLAQSRSGQLERQLQQFMATSAEPTNRQLGIASAMSTPLAWYGQQRANQFASEQAEAQMRAERARQMSGSTPGSCTCRTFIAGESLLNSVRRLRDKMFAPTSYVAKGYEAMSNWLVPIMKRNRVVKNFVKAVMLTPIATFCERYEKNPKDGIAILLVPVCYFWTKSWNIYGRIKAC